VENMKKKTKTPGDMLLEQIKKHGTNINAASKEMCISQTLLRIISLNEARITTDIAVKLACFFGVPAKTWLTAQMEYDLSFYDL
jgi:addiction module HigA family antidote